MKNKEIKFLLVLLVFHASVGFAQKDSLAEDPFFVNQQQVSNAKIQPWLNKTPEETRVWAKKNLHRKLTAKTVINEAEHPEWTWFRKSGLGLFIHWGLPSANPNTGDAWAIKWNERKEELGRYMEPAETMFAVADTWNPTNYNPNLWMKAASKAGFGYAVLTARHHDGYALWPSKHGDWDTGEKMNGRDLVKDYIAACRENNIKVGLYFSGPNWHYGYQYKDFEFPNTDQYIVNHRMEKVASLPELTKEMQRAEQQETVNQVQELMKNYGQIDLMWWDGNIPMSNSKLAEWQPNIFVARGNIATPEGLKHGVSKNLKVVNQANWWWEMCVKSENKWTPNWHYGVECETNHWDTNKLLYELIRCRAFGGNLLVNIPPKGNGEMMDWYYKLCEEMAEWMKHSQEATYDIDLNAPLPTLDKTQNLTTVKGQNYYSLPDDNNKIVINNVDKPKQVVLLRTKKKIEYKYDKKSRMLTIQLPEAMKTTLPDLVKITFKKIQ